MQRSSPLGLIFDIQRYALHDGPGIRTIVFMKGCPLRCRWCCNPESQSTAPEMIILADKCIGCGRCIAVCPQGIPGSQGAGLENCLCCGACARACPAEARKVFGRIVTVDEVMAEVLKDLPFYRNSNGGVTFSGGEPSGQAEFVEAVILRLREIGVHTAVETCGHAPWPSLAATVLQADLVLYDIKHMDPAEHRRMTGVDNQLILNNLRSLDAQVNATGIGPEIVVRMPLVPGYNDTQDHLRAVAEFVLSLNTVREVHLLPYHRLGEPKYRSLGREYGLQGTGAMTEKAAMAAAAYLREHGLEVSLGG